MTLRTDLSALLADAEIDDVDVDEAVADEHVRSSAYQRVVSVAADSPDRDGDWDRDRALVAAILRDPLEVVSKTAVVAFVDKIATNAADAAASTTGCSTCPSRTVRRRSPLRWRT